MGFPLDGFGGRMSPMCKSPGCKNLRAWEGPMRRSNTFPFRE
jgi:hypothetical protein